MSKSKKITLVLPPDERIKKHGKAWYFSGTETLTYETSSAFPLVCVGLWDLQFYKMVKGFVFYSDVLTNWRSLADGKINLSDCRFRKLTMKERKELGL